MMIYDNARSLKNYPLIKVLGQLLLADLTKNTFYSSFDTINILRIVSVKELLFLQQQDVPGAERVSTQWR
jgi:hypothetical protein